MIPKVLQKTVVAETDYLNLVTLSYANRKGDIGVWCAVERPNNTQAVVIVPIVGMNTPNARLVISREFRVPINGYEYGFPAGLIEPGEDPMVAAERELKEETGMSVKRFIRKCSPPVFNTAGITNEACYLAYVEAEGVPSSQFIEDSEDITTELMDREQILALMDQAREGNVCIGAKSWIIMERFCTYGDI